MGAPPLHTRVARRLPLHSAPREGGGGGGGGGGEGKEEEKAGWDPKDRSCTLKLDGHGRICDLTYLGREAAEPRNLRRLVGLQEAYANGCEASCHTTSVRNSTAACDLAALFGANASLALTDEHESKYQAELNAVYADTH